MDKLKIDRQPSDTMPTTRIEKDTMGEVVLPYDVYYGAQTQRAVENFPISAKPLPPELIRAMGLVKWAAAMANRTLGIFHPPQQQKPESTSEQESPQERCTSGSSSVHGLTDSQVEAMLTAAMEVAEGKWNSEFPVDVFQTGSGTSSNMNVNEVIANRALEILGQNRFEAKKSIHPNDHVNCGQSTNDTFPTAIHVAVACELHFHLLPTLENAAATLRRKATEFATVLKIGRTHLADATPMTLGQEFGGFAAQLQRAIGCCKEAAAWLWELPIGGTAVGTGINTHPDFGRTAAQFLSEKTGLPFVEARNHFEANAQRDALVACHSLVKTIAVTLLNVANNIRWLSSGPRCGFYEIRLPDLQPGSSIMPGKVNPVLCESVIQVAAKVIGNDATITTCGAVGGQFQLNIMMPVMADVAMESVRLLAKGLAIFDERCLQGIAANPSQCESAVEKSLAMVTGLNPYIGYERSAAIAKEAFQTGETVREVCVRQQVLLPDILATALKPQFS